MILKSSVVEFAYYLSTCMLNASTESLKIISRNPAISEEKFSGCTEFFARHLDHNELAIPCCSQFIG